MKLKKRIEKFIKRNVFIRKIARKVYYWLCIIKYKIITLGIKVDDKLIIFASFNGRSYCDSPKALYEYIIKNEKYKDYRFVWAFSDVDKHKFLEINQNTEVVNIKSNEFYRKMKQAKYWIFNYKIQDFVFPSKKQVFIQCWHGTPLKRLGCDLEHFDNAMNSISEIRKRYHLEASKFTYFISPSKFASEKFISTWDLKKICKENIIIEKGYPRNDFLYNYTSENIKDIKEKLNIKSDNKKIILYAPTYRDNQHSTEIGYTYKTQIDFDKLQKELSDEYIILFRAHWLVAQSFNFDKYKDFIIDVSDYDDINHLYVISDMLITDYSSVFFDYANLKRPIVFYMYDLEDYRDNIRGFYLNLEELPGKIVKKEKELIEEIKFVNSKFEYDDKYKKFNKKFNYLDDGQSSKRVIEKIIF
jgi:CDP-glycerol glycerophosphotransferase